MGIPETISLRSGFQLLAIKNKHNNKKVQENEIVKINSCKNTKTLFKSVL